MRFSILYVLFLPLFFHTSYSSESSFTSKPIHPKLGEIVLLACKLTAPDGYTFSGTVSDLKTSKTDQHQFNFDDIQSMFNDSRYHGWSIHDSKSNTCLQSYVLISSLNESDLSINFTCFQTLLQNDSTISASLLLNNFVQNTPTPSILTSTQTHASTTGSPSIHPTVTTPREVVSESSDFSYLLTIIGILSAVLCICGVCVLGQCITICGCIYFFWKKQEKNRYTNLTTATNTNPMQPLHLSNNAPSSESSNSSTSFKSCTSQLSNRECPKMQNDCSTEESHHARKILNSESGSEENL